MQHIFKKTLLVSALTMAIAPVAYATNGLAPIGVGQAQKAMGGTGVGNPQNTMSIATNPASASFINDGYDVGLEIFKPNRTATNNFTFKAGDFEAFTVNPTGTTTAGTSYSGDEVSTFLVPEFAYKKDRGNYSFGITAYGNGGMNTSYKNSPAFSGDANQNQLPDSVFNLNSTNLGTQVGTTGINLEQLFIAPTVSVKLNNNHSVGLSANLVYQRFEAKGISAVKSFSSDGANVTENGVDSATGIGATIGWMGKFSDGFTVGASYRLKTHMSKFKKYAGLFADQGRMNVPAALTVGFSKQISPRTQIAVDAQKIFYSDVNSIGNAGLVPGGKLLGESNGPGFGWSDQTVIKLGVKHQVNPKLALMGGFNFGDSPVGPEDTFFGSLAPAVVEQHVSLGLEYKINKKASIIGQYRHAFSNTVKGDSTKGQLFDLSMSQDALGVSYSKQF